MDTFRSIHKPHYITAIFIRPELHGHIVSPDDSKETPERFKRFKIRECEEKNLIGEKTYGNNSYSFYSIPESPLSLAYKACVIHAAKIS